MIEHKIKETVRDIIDFPQKGIVFKDITTLFKDPDLCKLIVKAFVEDLKPLSVDVIAGVESRGFLLGPAIAMEMGIPFVPIRKAGKLPGQCFQQKYALEYGTAVIEIHKDAIESGKKVLIHDDLLATGGTVLAASRLINQLGAEVAAFGFIIELSFLKGAQKLRDLQLPIVSLAKYT